MGSVLSAILIQSNLVLARKVCIGWWCFRLLIHSHPIGYEVFRQSMLGDMGIAWIDFMAFPRDVYDLVRYSVQVCPPLDRPCLVGESDIIKYNEAFTEVRLGHALGRIDPNVWINGFPAPLCAECL